MSESIHVNMSNCWTSHVAAQIFLVGFYGISQIFGQGLDTTYYIYTHVQYKRTTYKDDYIFLTT